jgi:hypothetical protein
MALLLQPNIFEVHIHIFVQKFLIITHEFVGQYFCCNFEEQRNMVSDY